VVAFHLTWPEAIQEKQSWNVEQARWLKLMLEDVNRGSHAYLSAEEDQWDKVPSN